MAKVEIIAPPTIRVAAPKPKMTIYYALLIIALCAMLAACGILYAEVSRLKRERGGSASTGGPMQTALAGASQPQCVLTA
jgi:hypothetical protein